MKELTLEETIHITGAAGELSRLGATIISTVSAATSSFAHGVYITYNSGSLSLASLSNAGSTALSTGLVAVPVTIGFMIAKELYSHYYHNNHVMAPE